MSPLPPDFEQRLAAVTPVEPRRPPQRRAAVAVILRPGEASHEVLLMRRADHPGDPWSGHVSFPGGGHEPDDIDLLHTALRETHEEVGLDLDAQARLLARLTPIAAVGRGRILPLDITPFVFRLEADVQPGTSDEAREVFWLPLAPVVAGVLDTEHRYQHGHVIRRLPAWDWSGHRIWGLTYRMLCEVLSAAGALEA